MKFNYKGRLVLITGASAGLGRQLALAFAKRGAFLALVARNVERLENTAQEARALGTSAHIFPCDLSNLEEIPAVLKDIQKHFDKPVDVLVHNAAFIFYGEIGCVPFTEIERLTRINYLSGVRLVQETIGAMKQARRGQIIWIASGTAYRGIPEEAAYSASKAASKAFCEAVRCELKPFDVDVLLTFPGVMNTDHGNRPIYSKDGKRPKGRLNRTPESAANAIVEAGSNRKSDFFYGKTALISKHLSYWAPDFLDWLMTRPNFRG